MAKKFEFLVEYRSEDAKNINGSMGNGDNDAF